MATSHLLAAVEYSVAQPIYVIGHLKKMRQQEANQTGNQRNFLEH
jgi:hypothetical protein